MMLNVTETVMNTNAGLSDLTAHKKQFNSSEIYANFGMYLIL